MQKNIATMHEPLPDSVPFGSIFRGIAAKVRNALSIAIPVGYQDETGFHMGIKPVRKN